MFGDLASEARENIRHDALSAGQPDDNRGLEAGGTTVTAYAESISVYLALAVDKSADYNSSLVAWSPSRDQAKTTFARQGLPMVWDFAEVNVFADAAGDIGVSLNGICRSIKGPAGQIPGCVVQADAQRQAISRGKWISTDPPYYDNIGYADLSDFFYIRLRRALRSFLPGLFSTIAVPKAEELVATPCRPRNQGKGRSILPRRDDEGNE
jgi:putative DNA methylase